MAISGIYQIQSKIKPERLYIGSAVNINNRWNRHRYILKFNKHDNNKLQRHYNKYGIDDLVFSIVAICNREDLKPLNGIIRPEQFFIWGYNPWFNIRPIAGSNLGLKQTETTRNLIRKGNIGKKRSQETRDKQSKSQKERFASVEGRKFCEKLAEISKGNKRHKGFKNTPETKNKMREKKLGKSPSEETREKLSKSATLDWVKRKLKIAS